MITHLKPDILECDVKWALESITMNKASGGDGIPVQLFQILLEWPSLKNLRKINAGERVEKRESIGGNVNLYSHYVKPYGGYSKSGATI